MAVRAPSSGKASVDRGERAVGAAGGFARRDDHGGSAVRRVTGASKRELAGGSALVMAGLGSHGLTGALRAVDDDDGTGIALGMGGVGAGR